MKKNWEFLLAPAFVACYLLISANYACAATSAQPNTVVTQATENPKDVAKDFTTQVVELQQILQKGTLVVGLPMNAEPEFYTVDANGQPSGFAYDLAADIAKELGVQLVISTDTKTYADTVQLLNDNKLDFAVLDQPKNVDSAQKILYSNPTIVFHRTLLINRNWLAQNFHQVFGDPDYTSIINTGMCRIGVIAQSSYANSAKELFKDAVVVVYPNWDDVMSALASGKIDAAFSDELRIKKLLALQPNISLKYLGVIFIDASDERTLATSPKNFLLREFLNYYLLVKNRTMTADDLMNYQTQTTAANGDQ